MFLRSSVQFAQERNCFTYISDALGYVHQMLLVRRQIVILCLVAAFVVPGCTTGNGIDRAYTPEPAVDIHSPHPIKARVRVRYSKFCGDQHRTHDHYRERCLRQP